MKRDLKPGDRFNRLTVVCYSHTGKHHRRYFIFKCDCGTEVTRQIANVTSGNTKSCGCLSLEAKENKRLPHNLGEVTAVYLGYRRHAKDRGLCFELTKEDFCRLITQRCAYCGTIGSNYKKTKNSLEGLYYNGVDRRDNATGYTVNNVVPCCRICNRAKHTLSIKEFKKWLGAAAEWQGYRMDPAEKALNKQAMASQWGSISSSAKDLGTVTDASRGSTLHTEMNPLQETFSLSEE